MDNLTVEKENNTNRVIIINNLIEQSLFGLAFIFVFNVCTKPQSYGISPGKRETNRMLFALIKNCFSLAEGAGERLYKQTGKTHLCVLMLLCNIALI